MSSSTAPAPDRSLRPPQYWPRFKTTRIIFTGWVCFALLALAAFLWLRNAAYEHERSRALSAVTQLSALTAEHLNLAIDEIDVLLRFTARHDPSEVEEQPERRRKLHRELRERLNAAPQIFTLALVAADGHVVAESGQDPPRQINIADRDYFKARLADLSLAMVMSEPIQARLAGKTSIAVAVAAPAPGPPAIAVATVNLSHFAEAMQRVGLTEGWSLGLWRQDGRLLLRLPDTVQGREAAIIDPDKLALLRAPAGGGFIDTSSIDGQRRVIGVRKLPDHPFSATVTIAEERVLAAADRSVLKSGVICLGAFVLGSIFFAGIYLSAARRDREAEAAIQADRAKSAVLAAMSHELRTPLNAVIGFSDLLLAPALRDAASDRRFIEQIRAAGHHLLGVVDQALDFAWIEGRRTPLGVGRLEGAELLAAITPTLSATAQAHGVEALVRMDPDFGGLIGDAFAARRAVEALALHACRNTAETHACGLSLRVDAGRRVILAWAEVEQSPAPRWSRAADALNRMDLVYAAAHGGMALTAADRLAEALGWRLELDESDAPGWRARLVIPDTNARSL